MSKEIKPSILALDTKIKAALVWGENGVASVAEDFCEHQLAERGVTKEDYIKVQDFITDMAVAGTKALGEASTPVMKASLDITQTSLSMPLIGKDKFEFTFTKERPIPVKNADGVAGTKTSWGSSSVSFEQYGLGKRGDMAIVKAMLTKQAAEAFGGVAATEEKAA